MEPGQLSPASVIIRNDRKQPDYVQSGCSYFSPCCRPPVCADRSASRGLNTHQLSAPPRACTGAEMLQVVAHPDQRTEALPWTQRNSGWPCAEHLIPSWSGPIGPQIQVLQSPPSLNLQTFTPCYRHQPGFAPHLPEMECTRFAPDISWMDVSPVASTPSSTCGFSPYVMVPDNRPAEFWYNPCLPPCSLVLLPEVHPSWCCPNTVTVMSQPCSPDQGGSRAAQQVGEQFTVKPESALSEREQNEEQAKSEDERQQNNKPDKDKLLAANTDDETAASEISAGSFPSLDSLAEQTFEEYMMIMNSISPKVGLTLNKEFLDCILSADPDAIDFLPYEEQKQEPLEKILQELSHPPSADPNPDPVLDAPDTQSDTAPNPDGQNGSLSSRNVGSNERSMSCSPLVPSLLLEASLPADNTTPSYNPADVASLPYYDGSIFMNYELLDSIFLGTSATTDLDARDNDAPLEEPVAVTPEDDVSEGTSMVLSNLADTQSQLPEVNLPEDPPASESPPRINVSGFNEDPHLFDMKDPLPSFGADLTTPSPQTASPPAQTVPALPLAQFRDPEEQRSPENTNPESCNPKNYAAPAPANSPFMTESHPSDFPGDGNSSDSAPEKQTVDPLKGLEVASTSVSPREQDDTERKREENIRECAEEREERTSEMLKRKERKENKEMEMRFKGTTNTVQIIHSQRLSGQTVDEKARRKQHEETPEKTEELTPERDRVTADKKKRWSSGERRLSKREESHFKDWSGVTIMANTLEQLSKIGDVEQHQKLTGEMQKLQEEEGEQDEANYPNVSTETGTEKALVAKMTQEEEELDEESFVSSKTKSEEDEVQSDARARWKIKCSELERCEIKSSPEGETPGGNKQENVAEAKTLLGSSQDVSAECSLLSLREPCQESPLVLTDTSSTKGEHPSLMLSPMKRSRHEQRISEEKETRVNETERINWSPNKRGRWRRRVEVTSERDQEQKLTENEKDEEQDKVETPRCKPSPPLTRSNRKTKDESSARLSSLAESTFGEGEGSVIETRTSRRGTSVPTSRDKRHQSKKLPSKYKTLILHTSRHTRLVNTENSKAGKRKTARGWRKMNN